MKPYMWRTRNSSYVYVDSMTGDDLGGDGTMGNPYRTLGRAYRGSSTAPGTIVCRGRFCEDMADGNHSTKITGDYMGAAVFDGEDVFLIYGFGHENMMIENCAEATYDLGVQAGSWANAGVGRSQTLGWVGHPSYMTGITGGGVIVGKSPLYSGCICGHTGAENVAVWSPKVSGQPSCITAPGSATGTGVCVTCGQTGSGSPRRAGTRCLRQACLRNVISWRMTR